MVLLGGTATTRYSIARVSRAPSLFTGLQHGIGMSILELCPSLTGTMLLCKSRSLLFAVFVLTGN